LSSEEVKAALGLDGISDRHWKIQVSVGRRSSSGSSSGSGGCGGGNVCARVYFHNPPASAQLLLQQPPQPLPIIQHPTPPSKACSAFTGAGLLDGIAWVVGDVAARVYTFD